MSYQYDIFLSYRRSRLHDAWLSESFVPLFWDIVREEITGETGRTPAGIFFDQTELTEEHASLISTELSQVRTGKPNSKRRSKPHDVWWLYGLLCIPILNGV